MYYRLFNKISIITNVSMTCHGSSGSSSSSSSSSNSSSSSSMKDLRCTATFIEETGVSI